MSNLGLNTTDTNALLIENLIVPFFTVNTVQYWSLPKGRRHFKQCFSSLCCLYHVNVLQITLESSIENLKGCLEIQEVAWIVLTSFSFPIKAKYIVIPKERINLFHNSLHCECCLNFCQYIWRLSVVEPRIPCLSINLRFFCHYKGRFSKTWTQTMIWSIKGNSKFSLNITGKVWGEKQSLFNTRHKRMEVRGHIPTVKITYSLHNMTLMWLMS